MAGVRLVCPLCGAVVTEGPEPAPGRCPVCAADYAGGAADPVAAAAAAIAEWGVAGVDASALARRLFEAEPAPAPAPTAAVTSDRREGFYLWWVFARGGADGVRAVAGA